MKISIILICIMAVYSCHKSPTEKQHKANRGCDTDSIIPVCVDSTGCLSFDLASNVYSIDDTVQNNFLNIYWICNPANKDIKSTALSNNKPVKI